MKTRRFGSWAKRLGVIGTLVVAGCVVNAQPGRPHPGPGDGELVRVLNRYPILKKMLQAEPTLRYSGTRIVELRRGPDRERNTEIILRDGPLQRTEFSPDSPNAGQIIVENGRKRRQFFPASNEVQVLPARRDEVLMRFRQMIAMVLQGNVKIDVEPGGEIADRRTQLATFADKAGNVIQKLWIDPETGMLLKRELFDLVGARIGYFEFKKVNYSPKIDREDFEIKRKGAREVTPGDQLAAIARRLGLPAARIPESEGYALEAVRPLELGGIKGLMQVYFGDRGRISLYIVSTDLNPQRMSRLAGANLNTFIWHSGDRTFALVGDVPRPELERLSKVVR